MFEENLWYVKLRKLYKSGRATEKTLTNAVNLGWISEEEMRSIQGEL
ncbi:MAG: XkdX family protein [Eubacteriales bacterium]|nr:XkdX family protein [Eubacteriales bacterium]